METASGTAAVEAGLEGLIEAAISDLASRLSIEREAIVVLEATPVVWPDTSLGCPVPGMRYLQVPKDGALIRLGVEDKAYAYHSGGSRGLILCDGELGAKNTLPNPIASDATAGGTDE